jgi:hypothetical protein
MRTLVLLAALAIGLNPASAGDINFKMLQCGNAKSVPPDSDPDPVFQTRIVTTATGEIYIRHFAASGVRYTRNEQYRDLKFWSDEKTDNWSGVSINHPDRTMVGRLQYGLTEAIPSEPSSLARLIQRATRRRGMAVIPLVNQSELISYRCCAKTASIRRHRHRPPRRRRRDGDAGRQCRAHNRAQQGDRARGAVALRDPRRQPHRRCRRGDRDHGVTHGGR